MYLFILQAISQRTNILIDDIIEPFEVFGVLTIDQHNQLRLPQYLVAS